MKHPVYDRPMMSCDLELSDHHVFFPRSRYRLKWEQEFRDLECNIIRNIPRWLHDILDQFPPEKPSDEFMLHVLAIERGRHRRERERDRRPKYSG